MDSRAPVRPAGRFLEDKARNVPATLLRITVINILRFCEKAHFFGFWAFLPRLTVELSRDHGVAHSSAVPCRNQRQQKCAKPP